MNWYNEIDRKKAAWLRELINRDVIAPGIVDERPVDDVSAAELAQYTQCHFFAGIGIWSYALRLAGWPDDRALWAGSCPCPPFSAAGKRKGKADKRHLWPSWFRLIAKSRPSHLLAEQVASRDGLAWLDDVYTDLEGAGYAVGAVDLCSAGFGAPHIRQRLYIVANAAKQRWERGGASEACGQSKAVERPERFCDAGSVADTELPKRRSGAIGRNDHHAAQNGWLESTSRAGEYSGVGPTNGFWRDAEWIWCRDEKYRPAKSGLCVLAARSFARILRLRGYGDGLTAPVAAEFIKAYMSAAEERGVA